MAIEVKGELGLFTREDSSVSNPTSYPAPTWSAVKGMIEKIFYFPSVEVMPLGVEILSEVRMCSYGWNYNGELRKGTQIAKGAGAQFKALVLNRPSYRLIFDVRPSTRVKNATAQHVSSWIEQFSTNLRAGSHEPLCFGLREFYASPSYITDTPICQSVNFRLPTMTRNPGHDGGSAVFFRDVICQMGRLIYPI